MTLTCHACGNEFDRRSSTGRLPKYCDPCRLGTSSKPNLRTVKPDERAPRSPRTANLRTVKPDERAPRSPRTAMSVSKAMKEGTPVEQLMAIRHRLAGVMDDKETSGSELASLTRRVLELSQQIEALQGKAEQERRENARTPNEAWDPEDI